MSKENGKPYVVTSDVDRLMRGWSSQTSYSSPDSNYYTGMSSDLKVVLNEIFKGTDVDIIDHEELRTGMLDLINDSTFPPVSMDRAYFDGDINRLVGHIDVTRTVDEGFNDVGKLPRPGYPPLNIQLDNIISTGVEEVTLVDDVLFSGGTVLYLAKELSRRGCEVKRMVAGVAIRDGVDGLNENGIEVASVYEYDSVIDEVCERDFRIGVPMSGRTVKTRNGQAWSAPYIRPFGSPEQWASIPEDKADDFSRFLIEQSIDMWGRVEQDSRTSVSPRILPRRVQRIDDSRTVLEGLRRELRELM